MELKMKIDMLRCMYNVDIDTYFYYYNFIEDKTKLVNLKADALYFHNLYDIWKNNNKSFDIQFDLGQLIIDLKKELQFVEDADIYIKKQCIYSINQTSETDTYYSSNEFINYMVNLSKLYFVQDVTQVDSFFLNSFLFNEILERSDEDFKPYEHMVYDVEKRIVSNTYYLNLFISNLTYIAENRLTNPTKDLTVEEMKFMNFIYNFDYYFLTILYHRYFLFHSNIIFRIDDNLSFRLFFSPYQLVDMKSLLCNLSIERTLKDFQDIFEIDLLSKLINYKNGSKEDLNNPLFLHILFLSNVYTKEVSKFSFININVSTKNRFIVDADYNKSVFVDKEKYTLNYLKKVIKGICFLNRYTNIKDWCDLKPFKNDFNDSMLKKDKRYEIFDIIVTEKEEEWL